MSISKSSNVPASPGKVPFVSDVHLYSSTRPNLAVIGKPTKDPHETVSGESILWLGRAGEESLPGLTSLAETTNNFMNNYGLVIIGIVASFVIPGQKVGVLGLGLLSGISVRLLQSALPEQRITEGDDPNIAQHIGAVLTKLKLANNVDVGYAGALAYGLKFFSCELPALITTFAIGYHFTAWAVTRSPVSGDGAGHSGTPDHSLDDLIVDEAT